MTNQELQILLTEYEEMNDQQRAHIRKLEAQNSYLKNYIINMSMRGGTKSTLVTQGLQRLIHDMQAQEPNNVDNEFLKNNGIRWK